MKALLTEFKPVTLFLVKFIGLYLVTNILYGLYVTAYEPKPDPATRWVTEQTALLLKVSGWSVKTVDNLNEPTTLIINKGKGVVSVYEGCNGLNVMIIFVAFIFAFGPFRKAQLWFVPLGVVIIHVSNLFRIGFLFIVALYFPSSLYYAHKYFFTAFIFAVVFALWIVWIRKIKSSEA